MPEFGKIGNWLTSLRLIRESQQNNSAESLYYYEWAERPVMLSESFYEDENPESIKFADGPLVIQDLMREIDSMFVGDFSMFNGEYLAEDGFRQHLLDRLKDPGVLHHFVFWDYGKDPTAMTFEWHHYRGNNHICVDMLNGQYYTIFGKPRLANSIDGPWERLVELYHDQLKYPYSNSSAQKLFGKVLGWPMH